MDNNITMDFVVTKDMMLLSRHILEYLGVEYETDGEGFRSEIYYTVPQVYRNEPINITLDKLNLMNSTVDDKRTLREALSIIDKIPTNVKKILQLDLDIMNTNIAHEIIQLYIKIAVILDDANRSLPKYKEWNDGEELTVQDYTQILLTKKMAHAQDNYTWGVRYGEVWTPYEAITRVTEYIENLETINKFMMEE